MPQTTKSQIYMRFPTVFLAAVLMQNCGLGLLDEANNSRQGGANSEASDQEKSKGSGEPLDNDSGSPEDDPSFVKICTIAEFEKIIDNMAGKYLLKCDLDFAGVQLKTIERTELFSEVPFSGIFDGGGHTIKNIYIDSVTPLRPAIFRYNQGVIRNLKVANMHMKLDSPASALSCLVSNNQLMGVVEDVEITGCRFEMGPNVGVGHFLIGGIVAANEGKIRNSKIEVTIRSKGSQIGGVAGGSGGSIENVQAIVDIEGGQNCTGGLVGDIHNAFSSNKIKTGEHLILLKNSFVSGKITSVGVTSYTGGAVGCMAGSVQTPKFIPRLESVSSTVELNGYSVVGGLVGSAYTICQISRSSSSGSVKGKKNLGGFIGSSSYCEISDATSTGSVTLTFEPGDGLLIVYGGFVGIMTGGTFRRCSATGAVDSRKSLSYEYTGGFAGFSVGDDAEISDSYASGDLLVNGHRVGGFIGASSGNSLRLTRVHTQSQVTSLKTIENFGGLIGFTANIPVVYENAFWNKDRVGTASNAGGGVALSTQDGAKQLSYTGFDFNSVWSLDTGAAFPKGRGW